MYEMLGLHEDSLVQYDELDALFTQFVLNHAAGGEFIVSLHSSQQTGFDLPKPFPHSLGPLRSLP